MNVRKILIASLFSLSLCTGAFAKEMKLAVVDLQAVLEKAIVTESFKNQREKITQSIQSELSKKEVELKKDEDNLSAKKGKISEEEFAKKVQEFNRKVSSVQKDVSEKQEKVEAALSKSFEEIQTSVAKVVNKIAKKDKINLVLPKSQVMFADDNLDITLEVITELNKTIKKVDITL